MQVTWLPIQAVSYTHLALALADRDFIIPMTGMVQSLNVSVASALILYEAQRQRQNAGMYKRENLSLIHIYRPAPRRRR